MATVGFKGLTSVETQPGSVVLVDLQPTMHILELDGDISVRSREGSH